MSEWIGRHPELLVAGLKAGVLIFVLLTAVAYMVWFERKLIAHIQSRWGPYRVGPHGLLQPLADGLKFLFKEDIILTNVTSRFVYLFAPFLSLALALLAVNPGAARAQTQIVGGSQTSSLLGGALFAGEKILFKNDGRIKLLVLNFLPVENVSDSAAEGMTRIFFSNLANTGSFDMVGSRDIDEAYKSGSKDQQNLVECRVLDCGVKIGKRQGADFVVVGSLKVDKKDNNLKTLKVRVINISNNLADFEEDLKKFEDEEETLFNLANDIKRNFLLRGRVLNTSIRGIVISLEAEARGDGAMGERVELRKLGERDTFFATVTGSHTAVMDLNR